MGKEGRNQQSRTTKVRCPAMIEAGIVDPDSYDGIQFCINDCPYPDCIAFSGDLEIQKIRETEAKRLRTHGYTVNRIAKTLEIARSTVERYLSR